MPLPKWSKNDLLYMHRNGYWIIPCESEEETENIKTICKEHNRCAQNGRVINKEGKEIFFVCTKDKGSKKGEKPITIPEIGDREMVIKHD